LPFLIIFGLQNNKIKMNPYLEIVLRSLAVYAFIVLAIRLFGKKEVLNSKKYRDKSIPN
jgi:hypothetical protein